MKRRLIDVATILSAILCATTVVLWIRSYIFFDSVGLGRDEHAFFYGTANGKICLEWASTAPGAGKFSDIAESSRHDRAPVGKASRWSITPLLVCSFAVEEGGRPIISRLVVWHGFELLDISWNSQYWDAGPRRYIPTGARGTVHFFGVGLPIWPVALITAVFPTTRRYVRRRARRRISGRCTTCGYDLRETPHVCPECGSTIKSDGSP